MKRTLQLAFFLLGCCAMLCAQVAPRPTERYKLQTGDVLELNYRYTPEFNQTITILPDGNVNLNIAGQMHLGGMTVNEAHDAILAKVNGQLNQPELNLVLKEFMKPYFVVAGEVEHTGRFDLIQSTTALQAVLLAGGFKDSAQQTQVVVFRRINQNIAEVHQLNLKRMHHTQDLERDVLLQNGDMIFVPRNKLEHLSRFMKAADLGLYFSPISYTATLP